MTTPAQPSPFISHFSVTSEAVYAGRRRYLLSIVKSVRVRRMTLSVPWKINVLLIALVLGLIEFFFLSIWVPWVLPLNSDRVVPSAMLQLVVGTVLLIVWLEYRRRSAAWSYPYGVWLNTKYGESLVLVSADQAHASAVAEYIKQALAARQTEDEAVEPGREPVVFYWEEHWARIDQDTFEVDGRAYPLSTVKSVQPILYAYEGGRSLILSGIPWILWTLVLSIFPWEFTTVVLVVLVVAAAFVAFALAIVAYRQRRRPDYAAPFTQIQIVRLHTASGDIDAVMTSDIYYVSDLTITLNRALSSRRARPGMRQSASMRQTR